MTALLESVIPDSIDPVEAYRCWTLENGKLQSLNGGGVGQVWTPGAALAAKCNANHGERYEWRIVRCGMSREKAEASLAKHRQDIADMGSYYWSGSAYRGSLRPDVPAVEPPDGYGFHMLIEKHAAPNETCSCGIYAASTENGVPAGGNVYGKVNLWGKVVPGEKGYRAEFAYPSEFRVAAGLADDESLKAFGIPIIVDDSVTAKEVGSAVLSLKTNMAAFNSSMSTISGAMLSFGSDPNRSLRRRMLWSCWINCAFAAVNIALVGVHFLG